MIGVILVVLGILMVFTGVISFNPKRGETMIVPFIGIVLGILYIILGIPRIQDPTWWEVIQILFFILSAGTVIGKIIIWSVKKTTFYTSLTKAIDSVPEIAKTIKSIENLLKRGGENE